MNLFSSVLWADEGAILLVSDSTFENNAAAVASILRVEGGATITCENCTITHNFAVTNSIFEVVSSGVMNLVSCQISNNFAIEYTIGTIFLTVSPSTLDNTEIHSNRAILPTEIFEEISENCTNL